MADVARSRFDVANDVVALDEETRAIYAHDADAYQALLRAAPWASYVARSAADASDPHYFRRVRISVVALLKMVLHARTGGALEVMGLMQGRVDADTRTFYVLDAFALPVQGTETRVNAQNDAYEYMVDYLQDSMASGRPENAIGWYHSHPGYRCWLSGIDVQTQQTNQRQDPFVAVVIDPHCSMSTGQVDIGAFRTYPAHYQADVPAPGGTAARPPAAVPRDKSADFGAHADKYYALDVQVFKTSAEAPVYERLWNQYWAHTLSERPSLLQRALRVQRTEAIAQELRDVSQSLAGAAMLPGGSSLVQAARAAPHPRDPAAAAEELATQLACRAEEQPLHRIAREAQMAEET
ncbi:COP9 signalosome catalytic subunit rri1 [Malassezia sp. CBS 17886]|nr:COP9 signalosome catalytic subunit rri1 [Malassezia sp. CBS 17886]